MKLTNDQKMLGLIRLGIESTIMGEEFIVHADKKDIPGDAEIEAAYLQYEAEKPVSLSLSLAERVSKLEEEIENLKKGVNQK